MQSNNILDLISIDRRSTVDFDLQLKESIKALVLDQTFYYHEDLPTPDELAEHLHIDVAVVESTYSQLVVERYVKKTKNGEFQVSYFELTNYFFDRNTAVWDAIKALGLTPSIECISKKVIKLSDEDLVSKGFNPKNGNKFLHIKRIYKGDNQPIMVLENFLPISVFPGIAEKFVGNEPLNNFLYATYGIRAEVSNRIIKSVNLTPKLAKVLNERKNAASVQSTNHIFDKYGRLIDFGQSHTISSYYFQALTTREEMKSNITK